MIEPTCSAFRFEDNSCQLYDANYLYKDKTDNPGMTVYMHDNLWSGRGNTIVWKFKISSKTWYILKKDLMTPPSNCFKSNSI